MKILSSSILDNSIVAVIVILAIFGGIALIAFLLRQYIPMFQSKDEKVDEETAVREEIERIIVKVDDPKVLHEMENFDVKETPKKK